MARFAVLTAIAVAAAVFGQAVDPARSVREPGADAATLRDDSSPADVRVAAARRLLLSDAPSARASLEEVFAGAPGEGPPRAELRAVINAIATVPSAPPWVLPRLAAILDDPRIEPGLRADLLAAAGSIRTREAARLLIDQAAAGRAAAFPALARLSGHDEFGTDLNRWRLWYEQVQWLSEAEWRRAVAEGLAARADELAVERDQAMSRLIDTLRQQYLALESASYRSARIMTFLTDPLPGVRRLGLALARQEVANARQLEPFVGETVVDLLGDVQVDMRRDAAALVNILVPASEADRVNQALRSETDSAVAAELLKAAARWPDPDLLPVILGWLMPGAATATPACDALDACQRRGWLNDGAGRSAVARALEVLRGWLDRDRASMPPSGLRLLVVLGGSEDRQRVFELLRDEQPAVRWAAATALAAAGNVAIEGEGSRTALDALIAAARSDSALYPIVAGMIASQRPTADGFRTLASLPAPDPVQSRERLLAMAAALPHPELLRAARATPDAQLREAMLARLLREPLAAQRDPGSPRTLKPEVIAGLLLLVDTRIELGQPAGALAALDVLQTASDRIQPSVLNDRRVLVLVWLNRLDEAARLDAGPDAWLDGVERSIGQPHAASALAACQARFPAPWSEPVAQRFRALSARLASPGPP